MPHVDGMSLAPGYRRSGESRFAEPVAAVTAAVVSPRTTTPARRSPAGRRAAASRRCCGRTRAQSWETRKRDEDYARATDLADLERMERDWDRRDGGGMRTWDWR